MSDETITFLILGAVVAVFIWDKLPVAIVALGVVLSLWATGVLTLEESLAGFGDPTVLFIASLFVVSEALDSAGITAWTGQELVRRAGGDRTRMLVLTMHQQPPKIPLLRSTSAANAGQVDSSRALTVYSGTTAERNRCGLVLTRDSRSLERRLV